MKKYVMIMASLLVTNMISAMNDEARPLSPRAFALAL